MFGHFTYLVLELAWAIPVLTLQWAVGLAVLLRQRRTWLGATLVPTAYLCAADRLALHDGIWRINPELSTGMAIAGLPIEEAIFFTVTNLMVVQTLLLVQSPEVRARLLGWWKRLAGPATRRAAAAGYRFGMFTGLLLALASTLIAAVQTSSSFLEPVAQVVMQATPVDIANVLLQRLGPASRPLALLGALAVVLALSGAAGAMTGAGWALLRPSARSSERPTHQEGAARRSRRAALDSGIVLAGAGGVVGLALADAARRDRLIDQSVRRIASFEPPAARVPDFPAPGQPEEVTPQPLFYIVSKNTQDPALDSRLWRLRIAGMVQRPLTLTFDDLLALPRRHEYVTLQCVSNPVGGSLMSTAYWSGTPLAALLERAGPLRDAGRVVMKAPDGHEESVPLAVALRPENLIAFAMNGELLTRLHGHPARGLIPGLYGFKQVKWLTDIELAPESHRGYWPRRGWTDDAIIRTTARVDVARRQSDRLLVAGMAFAGRRSISAVEVRLGAGTQDSPRWAPAELHVPPLSKMTWLQWRAFLPLPATPTADVWVEARAVDGEGLPQESAPSGAFPNGASGYHRVQVRA